MRSPSSPAPPCPARGALRGRAPHCCVCAAGQDVGDPETDAPGGGGGSNLSGRCSAEEPAPHRGGRGALTLRRLLRLRPRAPVSDSLCPSTTRQTLIAHRSSGHSNVPAEVSPRLLAAGLQGCRKRPRLALGGWAGGGSRAAAFLSGENARLQPANSYPFTPAQTFLTAAAPENPALTHPRAG